MFISKQELLRLKDSISLLEDKVKELSREYIGEVYGYFPQITSPNRYFEWKWRKFSRYDVEDEINGYIKIFKKWYKKNNVLFYDRYKKRRKEIEKREKEYWEKGLENYEKE